MVRTGGKPYKHRPISRSLMWGMWCMRWVAGGELYFSDVFCDRRLPAHLREDKEVCCVPCPDYLGEVCCIPCPDRLGL